MLIMITNKCNENCPHCMECSNPQGAEMQESTFANAMKFADFIGSNVITLSGGEPTMHPLFYDLCKKINFIHKKLFTICTNGTWFSCEAICERIKIVRRFEYCMGVQVYSNKRFYKDYEAVKAHEQLFRSLGCIFEETEIVAMKDLGRAKGNEEAQKMNAESRYFQSCLNASLAAKQVQRPKQYGLSLEGVSRQFCHPMVDFNGNVHLSESWLCPSVGNVDTDKFADIWHNIQTFKPCGKCNDYKRFMQTSRPDLTRAKILLGLY